MSKWWRDWVYFHRSERWALLVVALGACVLLVAVWILRGQVKPVGEDAAETTSVVDTLARMQQQESVSVNFRLHTFDPNTVTYSELVGMDIPPTLVVSLLKWRATGKVFRIAEEVMLTRGWDALPWDSLAPYVQIGDPFAIERYERHEPYGTHSQRDQWAEERQRLRDSILAANPYLKNKYSEFTYVNINTADTTQLMRVPGIGPHYAKTIVKQRERFGGFVSTDQLLEIEEFPQEAVEWFIVKDPVLRRIKLSTASVSEMGRHPYIDYDHARALAIYQRLYGPIETLERLRQTRLFTDEELERLAPYLDFDAE